MKTKGVVILVLFFVLFGAVSFAQHSDLKFEHITSDQGLPQNTVHGIVKDKYGFMWFGTWSGLCRYDGYSFKIYRYNPSDIHSINSNRIHSIIKDSDQNLWILTFKTGELCRYNYEKDNFERVSEHKVSQKFRLLLARRDHIETVNYTYKQYKWDLEIATNSLVRTDLYSNQKKYYRRNPSNPWSLNDPYVTDIYKDNHNIFWVGTFSNGLNKSSLNAKPFEYYYHDPFNSNTIVDNNVRAICEDNSGNLWIGTRDKGLTVIGKNGYRHINSSLGSNSINDDQIRRLFCDSRGIVWIGSKYGLNSYDPKTGKFRYFSEGNLEKKTVFGITEDSERNIWLASWRGVYKYIPSQNRLIHFDPEKTLKSSHTRVIIHDRKQQMWVGTEGGGISILKSIPGRDTLIVVKHLLDNSSKSNTISDNRVNAIYEDREGIIWIGTGNGLDRYDPSRNKFAHFSAESGLGEATVAAIIEDNNGYIWVSHKKGISRVNKKTFEARNFTLQDGLQSNEFSDGAALKSRFSNKLYMGGNNGFNAFNPDSIFTEKTLPNTVLTELQILNHKVVINQEINGRVVLSKPLYLTDEIDLTYDDKSVAIEFAGLHYTNPKANKYAYKLEGFDKDWVHTDADRRVATYSNLEPGNYTFKVMSSNCDGIWNEKPAVLKIVVKPPFWASIWAYILYLLIFLTALYIYHLYSLRYSRLKAKLSYELLIRDKENELHQNKLQFFTNISHEIKTPLTLILAPLEKLAHLFTGNKAIFSELMTMKSNGDRLLKLVNQLLDFRKLETGNVDLKRQRNDIIAFLKNIMNAFEPLAEAKNVKLEFNQHPDRLYFSYDEDKIEKVISNLLSNALKFTPAAGSIKLNFDVKQEAWGKIAIIEVTNTGKIIPRDEWEKIFKPFQQGSGNKAGGTGLGLAYSKGLIELHGGTISVSSLPIAADKAETRFTVELPLGDNDDVFVPDEIVEGAGAAEPTDHDSFVVDTGSNQQHNRQGEKALVNGKVPVVLIVEDSIDLRKYLREYFENSYQILEAENGLGGLKIASEEQPDLIISDVMMPEMDGFELCKRIKTETKTAHIPIILLTARTPVEDRIEGIETGADDYITKPFNLAVLTARVKNLLISRSNLKEKYRKEISLKPTEEIPVSPDEKLMKKLLQYVEDRLSDSELSVDDICSNVGVSRTQLYRKIKAMTGLSMAEVIKEIRLKRAKQLLRDRKFNINEVAHMVGFSDTDYFRKCFKAEFGITPSEYYKSRAHSSENLKD